MTTLLNFGTGLAAGLLICLIVAVWIILDQRKTIRDMCDRLMDRSLAELKMQQQRENRFVRAERWKDDTPDDKDGDGSDRPGIYDEPITPIDQQEFEDLRSRVNSGYEQFFGGR